MFLVTKLFSVKKIFPTVPTDELSQMLLSLATGFIISVTCYIFIVTLVYFLWLVNFQHRFLKAM